MTQKLVRRYDEARGDAGDRGAMGFPIKQRILGKDSRHWGDSDIERGEDHGEKEIIIDLSLCKCGLYFN